MADPVPEMARLPDIREWGTAMTGTSGGRPPVTALALGKGHSSGNSGQLHQLGSVLVKTMKVLGARTANVYGGEIAGVLLVSFSLWGEVSLMGSLLAQAVLN